jgi:chemotaxis protein MotB
MKKFAGALVLVAAVSFISGCGIKEEVYVRDTSALKDQISGLERQKADLVAQREKLNTEIARVRQEKALLSQEKGELSTDLQSALDRVEELRLQAEARKAKLAELRSKLDEMVASGKLTVRTDKGRMIVEMGEQILFDSGRFKLKPEGADALSQLTGILVGIQGRVFQVAGHTDAVGADDKNWRLSANRALEVALYMIEAGMPADRISAVGYGETQPVGDNETPEGRALNRRIEIVLQPNIDEILGFTDN